MNPPSTTAEPTAQVRRPGVTPPSRRGGSGRRLDDVVVDLGFVGRDEMDQAVMEAQRTGASPERVLLQGGRLSEEQLSRAVAERFGLDHVDLTEYRFDPNAAKLVTPAAVKRYQAIPVSFVNDRTLLVAMADPANVLAVDDIAVMTGYEVRPAVAAGADIERALDRLDAIARGEAIVDDIPEPEPEPAPVPGAAQPKAGPLYDLSELQVRSSGEEDASVIGLVHRVISEAVERGTSDIHFEPFEDEMKVRYRIDGVLLEAAVIPGKIVPTIISRVKILGDLDIAERRIPQDGRISMELEDKRIDIRVVTLPTSHGESVVMRILDQSNVNIQLDQLGMLPQARERFTKAFSQAYGAVLVTGPTGSGKSTSLYAALNQLNTPEKNIITIEDPVEYQMTGISQVQVNNKAGLTFAQGLRAMMRADPDIIMVGEIRDRETAQIAIEASLTGHLVLSTLHTNDAPTADHPADRDGHRAVPGRHGHRRRGRPAPRPAPVRRVQAPRHAAGRGPARQRLQRRPRPRVLRARRLRPLRRHGLQGPDRPLRGHDGLRDDPPDGGRPRHRGRHRPRGRARGHDAPARGRPREGPPRRDVDRRDRARRRLPRLRQPARRPPASRRRSIARP